MPTQQQKPPLSRGLKIAALGTLLAGLAGCAVYPNPPPSAQYSDGYYSYYSYPSDYYYYDSNGHPTAYVGIRPGYSDDPNLHYDAQDRAPDHSDDHNFHNRDDFDHWDY